jgi:hypothetical protein
MIRCPGGVFQYLVDNGIIYMMLWFELFGKSGTAAANQLVESLYIKIHWAKLKD